VGRKFGESSVIRQTKTIQISTYNHNLWLNLLIRQTFLRQMLETSKFAKLSRYMVLNYFKLLVLIHFTVNRLLNFVLLCYRDGVISSEQLALLDAQDVYNYYHSQHDIDQVCDSIQIWNIYIFILT